MATRLAKAIDKTVARIKAPPTESGPNPNFLSDAQFTLYRPKIVQPKKWYDVLVFAHRAEKTADAPADELPPLEQVSLQAQSLLADKFATYRQSTQDSHVEIPAQSQISFVPYLDGTEFNPPSRTFQWLETVHRQDFRMQLVDNRWLGKTLHGRVSIFLGTLLVADINMSIRVESHEPHETGKHSVTVDTVHPYRRIFASYSHKDRQIVEHMENLAKLLGDEYLVDCRTLRAGELWNERLRSLIEEADIFQLFWSWNSIDSVYIRQEWEHAASLRRPHFIRPVYWEEPLPSRPERGLPPPELQQLHFQQLHTASTLIPIDSVHGSHLKAGRYGNECKVDDVFTKPDQVNRGSRTFLELVKGTAPGARFELDSDRSIIGSSAACDVLLEVPGVSRRHAAVYRERGRYFIEDLQSRNGTFLNDKRLTNRAPLDDGDQLVISDQEFRFYSGAGTGALDPMRNLEESNIAELVDDNNDHAPASVVAAFDVGDASIAKPEVKLASLIEISNNLAQTLGVEEIQPKILDNLFKLFAQADHGFVVMRPKVEGPLVPVAVKTRRAGDEDQMRISRTIVDEAMRSSKAILFADAVSDERFGMAQSTADSSIRSVICAPIIGSDGQPLGVIQIDTMNQRARFTDEDLEVLACVASQVAVAIENARMLEQVDVQRATQQDMDCARKVVPQPLAVPTRPRAAKSMAWGNIEWLAMGIDRLRQVLTSLPQRRLAYAVATVLLFAMTTVLWFHGQPTSAVAQLAKSGWPGRADFGVSPDLENSTTEMGAGSQSESEQISEFLAIISDEAECDQLRKAYEFLDQNQLIKARDAFAAATEKYPHSYYAWLGQGIAYFKGKGKEDFQAAEAAFRSALKLHPHPNGARYWLAMTLTWEGLDREALTEWERVDVTLLPDKQRDKIGREMEWLQRAANK